MRNTDINYKSTHHSTRVDRHVTLENTKSEQNKTFDTFEKFQ